MNLLTILVGYLIYCLVVMAVSVIAYPGKATVTGWRAFLIIPGWLPVIALRILFGEKHRFYRTKGWGFGIEFND